MSFTNQIIIPVVASRKVLEEQNPFSPPTLPLTPHKPVPSPELLPWKKTNSAFKKFKDRKDKKDKQQEPLRHDLQNLSPHPSHSYTLAKRINRCTSPQKHLPSPTPTDFSLSYYDPNDAPLYDANFRGEDLGDDEEMLLAITKKRLSKSKDRIEDEIRQERPNKMSSTHSSKIQEEPLYYPVLLVHPDDPFIIIHSDSRPKACKSGKTKFIKKQSKSFMEPPKAIVVGNRIAQKSIVTPGQSPARPIFSPPIQIRTVNNRNYSSIMRMTAPTMTEGRNQAIQIESSSQNSWGDQQDQQQQKRVGSPIECD